MFSELPKLFDRNFVIAYFLPTSIFIAGSWFLLDKIGLWAKISARLTNNSALDITIIAFITWIISILLLVLNREIYRFLEGYYNVFPFNYAFSILKQRAENNYSQKNKRLEELGNEYLKLGKKFPETLDNERNELLRHLAERFPDSPGFVLPTNLGNAIRAFEIYPRVMYGLEGINGWIRILAVIPKDFRELINDAKAQVDWWINLEVLACVYVVEFWLAVHFINGWTTSWKITLLNLFMPLLALFIVSLLTSWRATSAAIGWGEYVKAAFDLYRSNLFELLGGKAPSKFGEETAFWEKFSQAIIYRLPDRIPELKKQEEEQKTKDTRKK